MDKGMIIYILIMSWTLIIYGGLTYLIAKKKNFDLISGFSNRPQDEKEYLQKNGYIDALTRLLKSTFFLLLISFLAGLLPIPFGMEIGLAIFMLVLLSGIVWISKYEVPHKRKRSLLISGSIMTILLTSIIGLSAFGLKENDISLEENQFIIKGMYGGEVPIENITEVRMIDSLPDAIKTNGFAFGHYLKGQFKVEGYGGTGKLFVHGKSDQYLLIETTDSYIIFNQDSENKLYDLYEKWKEKVKEREKKQ